MNQYPKPRLFRTGLFLAVLLLGLFAWQPAEARLLTQERNADAAVCVKGCHWQYKLPDLAPCCRSLACHQTGPAGRDLDAPSYQSGRLQNHPLVHETHQLHPQWKAGTAFRADYRPDSGAAFRATRAQRPLQSLALLRSVVLRH